MRYYLILRNRKTRRFGKFFQFKSKQEFKEELSSYYKDYPVLKFEYIYGVCLLTTLRKPKEYFK
jgi:hypothetical protein